MLARSMASVPNPAILFPGQVPSSAGMAAEVVRAPSGPTDTIDVRWTMPADEDTPEEDGRERDVRWWCQSGAVPVVGDYALLMTDSQGDPVAFVWASQVVEVPEVPVVPREVAGSVDSTGAESSSEFSVVKNGTGDYTVTYTTPFASTPHVVVGKDHTGSANIAKLHAGTPPTASVFRVFTIVGSTGAATDGGFTFIAREA